jgi:hypothetical protein
MNLDLVTIIAIATFLISIYTAFKKELKPIIKSLPERLKALENYTFSYHIRVGAVLKSFFILIANGYMTINFILSAYLFLICILEGKPFWMTALLTSFPAWYGWHMRKLMVAGSK